MNPESVQIPLLGRDGSVRAATIVDVADSDALSVYTWHLDKNGYVYRYERLNGRQVRVWMHREILGLPRGVGRIEGTSQEGDHRDGNPLDNRRRNLRVVTHAENMQNRRTRRDSSSGLRNVSFYARTGRWLARAMVGGKLMHIGYFPTAQEAGEAAARWRSQHMTHAEARE